MKTTVTLLALSLAAALPARAQLFRPEAVTGAVLGGVAGAVIGHNDGRHGWEGAAYGAAAGALIGTIVGESRDHAAHRATQVPVPVYRHSYYTRYHHRPYRPHFPAPRYVYRHPVVVHPRPYVYVPRRHVRTGVLLGGIAGAIIGHNDGRHGWEGAAYGIGAGYLLGSIADRQARERAEALELAELRAAAATPAPAPAPQQVTIINNYYGATPSAPMAAANGLFGR